MRASAIPRSAGLFLGLVLSLVLGACSAAPLPPPRASLESLRSEAAASSDGELVGRWLIGELLLPGGDPKRAVEARKKLESFGMTSAPGARGMFENRGEGLDRSYDTPSMMVRVRIGRPQIDQLRSAGTKMEIVAADPPPQRRKKAALSPGSENPASGIP